MEELQRQIDNLLLEINNLYSLVLELQLQQLDLLNKFKEMEGFWYEK